MKPDSRALTFALSLALVASGTASSVHAQDVADSSFQLGFQLDGRYDSNVANTNDARAELTRVDGSDFIISPSLFMNINKEVAGFELQGNVSLGYDFYAENSELDSERLFADLQGETRLGFCSVQPGLSFRRQQQELFDRAFVDDAALALDNVQTVQEYRLDLGCGQEIGIRALGGVAYERGDNSNEIRNLSDYESFTYSAGIGYRQPSIGALDIYASQEKTDYENRIVDGVQDSYEVRRYGASFERDIGARLKGRIEGFVIDLDAPGTTGPNFNGTGWNFDLSATLGARVTSYVTLGQDVQPVLNNDALYMKARNWGAGVSFALNDRATLNGAYARLERDYVYSDLLPADEDTPLLDDSLDQFTGSVDFRGSGRLGFSLYGGYENRSSNDAFYDYDGFFAGVKMRYLLIR